MLVLMRRLLPVVPPELAVIDRECEVVRRMMVVNGRFWRWRAVCHACNMRGEECGVRGWCVSREAACGKGLLVI